MFASSFGITKQHLRICRQDFQQVCKPTRKFGKAHFVGSIRGSPNSSRNPYYEPTSRVHDTATRNFANKCQDFANEETYNLPCMGKSLKRENFCGFQLKTPISYPNLFKVMENINRSRAGNVLPQLFECFHKCKNFFLL